MDFKSWVLKKEREAECGEWYEGQVSDLLVDVMHDGKFPRINGKEGLFDGMEYIWRISKDREIAQLLLLPYMDYYDESER